MIGEEGTKGYRVKSKIKKLLIEYKSKIRIDTAISLKYFKINFATKLFRNTANDNNKKHAAIFNKKAT